MAKKVCREYGISNAVYGVWKSKFGGMEASDIKRTSELKCENARLKRMLTELSLKNRALEDVSKKSSKARREAQVSLPCPRKARIEHHEGFAALRLSRMVLAYQVSPWDDMPVTMALFELVEAYPRYGFPKYFGTLRRKGDTWNHKQGHRIYRELNLHLRRKGKRRLPWGCPQKEQSKEGKGFA